MDRILCGERLTRTSQLPQDAVTGRLRISKQGDRYLRMLLTHGARAVLRAAAAAVRAGKPVDDLRQWALAVQQRANHNKAACALANKLARICYATLRDGAPYVVVQRRQKTARTAFALPA